MLHIAYFTDLTALFFRLLQSEAMTWRFPREALVATRGSRGNHEIITCSCKEESVSLMGCLIVQNIDCYKEISGYGRNGIGDIGDLIKEGNQVFAAVEIEGTTLFVAELTLPSQ